MHSSFVITITSFSKIPPKIQLATECFDLHNSYMNYTNELLLHFYIILIAPKLNCRYKLLSGCMLIVSQYVVRLKMILGFQYLTVRGWIGGGKLLIFEVRQISTIY